MSHGPDLFLLGGFSESEESLSHLGNELAKKVSSKTEVLPWEESRRQKGALAQAALHAIVVTHSAGIMNAPDCDTIVAIAGVEPTHPYLAVSRALKVARNAESRKDCEVDLSRIGNIKHVVRNPEHLLVLARVGIFSTADRLIYGGHKSFPGGRFYLPAQHDEFGFGTDPRTLERVKRHGITAQPLGRFHSDALSNPKSTAATIYQLLEAPQTQAGTESQTALSMLAEHFSLPTPELPGLSFEQ